MIAMDSVITTRYKTQIEKKVVLEVLQDLYMEECAASILGHDKVRVEFLKQIEEAIGP